MDISSRSRSCTVLQVIKLLICKRKHKSRGNLSIFRLTCSLRRPLLMFSNFLCYIFPVIVFRKITSLDIDSLIQLMPVYYRHDHLEFDPQKARQALELFITKPDLGQIWLIQDNSGVIGYMIMTYGFSFECSGREAFIDELFILAEHRGKGAGSKAIQHAENHAKKMGIKMIRLEVTKTNPEAMKLYLRSGFQDWDRTLLAMPLKP